MAGLTVGLAGADLANVVNEAALVATKRRADAVQIQRIVQAGFECASEILATNRGVLEHAARALLAKETLDETELAGLVAGLVPWQRRSVAAAQHAAQAGRTELTQPETHVPGNA